MKVQRKYGRDSERAVLGHKGGEVTAGYEVTDLMIAAKTMREME